MQVALALAVAVVVWHWLVASQRSSGMTAHERVHWPSCGIHVHSVSVAQVVASKMDAQVRLQKPLAASHRHSGWAEHSAKVL